MSMRLLPRPGMIPEKINSSLRVLLMCNSENSLTKRVANALKERKVNVQTTETSSSDTMTAAVDRHSPDIVICPFMKSRIPETLYKHPQRPCLIVHPGVAGDRGASSIDWAIHDNQKNWGVTVLEADREMDAGAIWSTSEFKLNKKCTKTSMYVGDVSDHAVKCVIDAIARFTQNISPTALNYSHPEIWGTLKRNMKKADRIINWNMSAEEIVRRVRMSDTQPGAIGTICVRGSDVPLRLFDAHLETADSSPFLQSYMSKQRPGDMIAHKHGAVLIKAGDEHGVWIGQMKNDHIKLPATEVLQHYTALQDVPELPFEAGFRDITVQRAGPVCFVHFDFYNGAMDKHQACRLERVIREINRYDDVKTVVMMGGKRFFSTGIHLCAIQNSDNKAREAWENINKIDDVILALSEIRNKVTVAVLQGNAGAGGAMLAAACDVVLSHPGALVTPTYKAMSLHGSEYWTYYLPRRVGTDTAQQLVTSDKSLSALQAKRLGLIDDLMTLDRDHCEEFVENYANDMLYRGQADKIISEKVQERNGDWFKNLGLHREKELKEMKINFQQTTFLNAMKAFVYHEPVDHKQVQCPDEKTSRSSVV